MIWIPYYMEFISFVFCTKIPSNNANFILLLYLILGIIIIVGYFVLQVPATTYVSGERYV